MRGGRLCAPCAKSSNRAGTSPSRRWTCASKSSNANTSLNEEKIAALRETLDSLPEGSGSGTSADGSVAQMIAELVVRNVQIKNEMSALNETDITAFEGKVQKMYASMQTAAENFEKRHRRPLRAGSDRPFMRRTAPSSRAAYEPCSSSRRRAFVLGFLIAAVVVCRVEYGRQKKRAAAQNAGDRLRTPPLRENGTSQDA